MKFLPKIATTMDREQWFLLENGGTLELSSEDRPYNAREWVVHRAFRGSRHHLFVIGLMFWLQPGSVANMLQQIELPGHSPKKIGFLQRKLGEFSWRMNWYSMLGRLALRYEADLYLHLTSQGYLEVRK